MSHITIDPSDERPLLPISVAAELAGVHPQTLRMYERRGLVVPGRTEGGTRRYSGADVARTLRICALVADGHNLAGIERILALEAEVMRMRQLLAEREELLTGALQQLQALRPATSTALVVAVKAAPPARRR